MNEQTNVTKSETNGITSNSTLVDKTCYEEMSDFWFPVEPDGFCKWGERRDKTIKKEFQEGVENAKKKFPNTIKLLEEDD